MSSFLTPLHAPSATDPDVVGPKAANLARLTQADLPTPGGVSLTAAAYRAQIAALGLKDAVRNYASASPPQARRLSVEIRLALYEKPIAPDILVPLLAAWRALTADGQPGVVRS